jgi:hypothetical protein
LLDFLFEELTFVLALQTEVVLVAVDDRQVTQRRIVLLHHRGLRNYRNRGRRRLETGDSGCLVGDVKHLHTGVVHDDDLADETIGFFHEHDIQLLAVGDIEADLRTADTDGGNRRIKGHGVRISLGDLAGHECEHTLQRGHRDGTLLRRGIVDHLVEHHAAVLAHGERRFIGKQHTDGTVGAGFENVALVDGVADLQLDPRTDGTNGKHVAREIFDVTDRLAVGTGDDGGIGGNRTARGGRRGGAIGAAENVGAHRTFGQLRDHFTRKLGTAGRRQLRRIRLAEVILDEDRAAVRRGHDEIVAFHLELGGGQIETLRQGQGLAVAGIQVQSLLGAACGCGGEFGHFTYLTGREPVPLKRPTEIRCFVVFLLKANVVAGKGFSNKRPKIL